MWRSAREIIKASASRFASRAVLTLLASGAINISVSYADTNFAVGDCNVQLINSTAQSIVVCPRAPNVDQAISIKYFWLDSRLASFLVADQMEPRLRVLLGDGAYILRNEVHETFKALVDRFGSLIGAHSKFSGDHYDTQLVDSRGNVISRVRQPFRVLKRTAFQNVRIYDGEGPIFWPDLAAMEQVLKTPNLPPDYRYYYRIGGGMDVSADHVQDILRQRSLTTDDQWVLEGFIALSLVTWRDITGSELRNYESLLQTFSDRALQQRLLVDFPVVFPDTRGAPMDDGSEALRRLVSLAGRKNISAMQYVARDGLPPGFLTAYGLFHGSHGLPEWTIIAVPPRLFMRIAVVENVAPTPANYSLRSFSIRSSVSRGLRAANIGEQGTESTVSFPPGILGHREKIVVPLSLEFRRSFEYGPEYRRDTVASDPNAHSMVTRALNKLPGDNVRLLETAEYSGARKPKRLLGQPQIQAENAEFFFGPRFELRSALIDGKAFPIRLPETRGVFTVAGIQGGSCPVLYTRSEHGDLIKVGTVLRAASGSKNRTIEKIVLPKDTIEVVISEEEAEITILDQFEVHAVLEDGNVLVIAHMSGPRQLRDGQFVAISLPELGNVRRYEVIMEGYYETYASMLAKAALAPVR